MKKEIKIDIEGDIIKVYDTIETIKMYCEKIERLEEVDIEVKEIGESTKLPTKELESILAKL